jgi:hypothetical protein
VEFILNFDNANMTSKIPAQVYEVGPRNDHRGVNMISDALLFGRLWYDAPENAMHRSRSHHAVIRVYDVAGNVIETHKHNGNFNDW